MIEVLSPGVIVDVGVGIGVSKMFKIQVKFFYIMGKALTGKLSCMLKSLVSLSVLSLGRASAHVLRLKFGFL